jgi:hypothetical protein
MPSKQLMAVWGFLDFCVLAAGAVTITFSILYRAPDVVRNLILNTTDLTVSMVLGIVYVVTFMVSIGAIIQRNHITIGLVILNWVLILTSIFTVVYGANLWFMTLREEHNFGTIWNNTTPANRLAVQDKLQCCGFLNNTSIEFGGLCTSPAVAQAIGGCSTQFIGIADNMFHQIFSTIFGFTTIIVSLFVATLCVIKKREEQERFRRIDAKRGGRGFV